MTQNKQALEALDRLRGRIKSREDRYGDLTILDKGEEEFKTIRAALEEQERGLIRGAGDGWMPMESAPKDEYIIVWQPDTFMPDQTVVCWDDDDQWWHCCDGKNPDIPVRGADPTHWQPLPTPPKGQNNEKLR